MLYILFVASLILKLILTIKLGPLGLFYGAKGGLWHAMTMVGYSGEIGYREKTAFLRPYLASIFFRLDLPVELYMYLIVFLSVIVPVLAHRLVKYGLGEQVALLTLVLISCNWSWTFWSFYLAPAETTQVMLGVLTLILLQEGIRSAKGTFIVTLSGCVLGLAFHTKIQAVAMVPVAFALLYLERKRVDRNTVLMFLFGFLSVMLFLIPVSASYSHFLDLTSLNPQRGLSITLPEFFSAIISNLLRIPYEISLFTLIFAVMGLAKLLREARSETISLLLWFGSYFLLYALISTNLKSNLGYYSLNWLVPLLVFAAVGMDELMRRYPSTLTQLLVLVAVLSTYVEGPLPFVRLEHAFPFLGLKDSTVCYQRLVTWMTKLSGKDRLFYDAMLNFTPTVRLIPADLFLAVSLLLPLSVSFLSSDPSPFREWRSRIVTPRAEKGDRPTERSDKERHGSKCR